MRKQQIKDLASRVMRLADRRGWGLGECGYYFNRYAIEDIEECEAYIPEDANPFDKGGYGCTVNHDAHIREARTLADEAEAMAFALDDMGITRID